jgi:hypothetical protein
VDVAGVNIVDYFEVIEIIGEMDPYPTLLRIDWVYVNYAIIGLVVPEIKLKDQRIMSDIRN